ncbi:NUDIX domain-containing protein [Streptomyces flavofungini]|uniref:NUDIX domain-containing protein n=1 Tax=Streptomyces flavofungini TaxID=68200 RepID=UPI0025AFB626|nr:NUDIX domain-containing protein [Streptomyces flavofungini]WJV46528.1 NUDIX domain-containing protein [Streptomyces flavofungini]
MREERELSTPPRRRVRAAVLFLSEDKDVLLVELRHQKVQTLPESGVRAGEGPQDALARLANSSLGLFIRPHQMLVHDVVMEPCLADSYEYVFFGGILNSSRVLIHDRTTLSRCLWVPQKELADRASPEHLNRILLALMALKLESCITLVNGQEQKGPCQDSEESITAEQAPD